MSAHTPDKKVISTTTAATSYVYVSGKEAPTTSVAGGNLQQMSSEAKTTACKLESAKAEVTIGQESPTTEGTVADSSEQIPPTSNAGSDDCHFPTITGDGSSNEVTSTTAGESSVKQSSATFVRTSDQGMKMY